MVQTPGKPTPSDESGAAQAQGTPPVGKTSADAVDDALDATARRIAQMVADAKSAVDAMTAEVQGVHALAQEVNEQLEAALVKEKQLGVITVENTAELMVLTTALRPPPPPCEPMPVDESTEDMIDPEFGLLPARSAIAAAAKRIMEGYAAFLPQPTSTSAAASTSTSGDDESG